MAVLVAEQSIASRLISSAHQEEPEAVPEFLFAAEIDGEAA
jgi:hypothetical protein